MGEPFDRGIAHERSALAWERTSMSIIVNGVLLTRYASVSAHWTVASLGLAETIAGGALLIWAGFRYEDLHGQLRAGVTSITHPSATRLVGGLTLLFTGAGLVLGLILSLIG